MKMRVLRIKMMISRGLNTKEEENNLFFNVLFSIDGKINVSAAKKIVMTRIEQCHPKLCKAPTALQLYSSITKAMEWNILKRFLGEMWSDAVKRLQSAWADCNIG